MNRILIAIVLLAGSAASAEAQRSSPLTFWIQAGAGVGQLEDPNSVVSGGASAAFAASASLQKGNAMFSVRAATVTEIFDDHVSDIGVLAGLATRPTGPFHAGLAVGLGRAEGVQVSGPLFGGTVAPTAGRLTVPAELQLSWRPLKFLGLGVYGFASFNKGQTFGGGTLSLQLGRLR